MPTMCTPLKQLFYNDKCTKIETVSMQVIKLLFYNLLMCLNAAGGMTNSVDPDQMPHTGNVV